MIGFYLQRLSTIVKAKAVAPTIVKPIKQKVILVKKVPLKKDSDDDSMGSSPDDLCDMDISGGSEKFVKFASTAEVREIAPRRYSSPTRKSFRARQDFDKEKSGNIRARLGLSKLILPQHICVVIIYGVFFNRFSIT